MQESRLNKNLQKKAWKNILLTIGGILVLIFILIQFGPQILINFSLTVEKLRGSNENLSAEQEQSYILPPTLNPMESATNSAKINLSGYSLPNQKIKLYVNGDLVKKVDVKKDKTFTFSDIELKPGENDIKTKAVTENDQQSQYSSSVKINYINKPPSLEIESLSDGQSLSKDQSPLKVSGKTDSGNKVTVNGFWAIISGDGKFSYSLKLDNGENKIKIEATDKAGNKTTKEIKVTYSP